jgi:hypothetical protein
MHIFLFMVIGIGCLFLAFLLWGFIGLHRSNAKATEAIRNLSIADIAGLIAEGKEELTKAYGLAIDINDSEAAARILDGLFIDKLKLKKAFKKENFYWRFVLPIGAMVGEFIRIHAKGAWKQDSNGPFMDIPIADGVATCYPFDKVLKQMNSGKKGDLCAFLLAATQLSSVERTA